MRWRRANRGCGPRRPERGVERRLAALEVVEHLLVADGLPSGARERAGCRERPDLVDQPCLAHAANRVGDPRATSTARGSQTPSLAHRDDGGAELAEAEAERRERPAGEPDHLERADDPARVPGLDA